VIGLFIEAIIPTVVQVMAACCGISTLRSGVGCRCWWTPPAHSPWSKPTRTTATIRR